VYIISLFFVEIREGDVDFHVFQVGVHFCVKVNSFFAAFWISPKIAITRSQW